MRFPLNEWYEDEVEYDYDDDREDYFDSNDADNVWEMVQEKLGDKEIARRWVEQVVPELTPEQLQEFLDAYEINSIDELNPDDLDIYDCFADLQDYGFLEDEFDEAKEEYMDSADFLDAVKDAKEYQRDPLGYYGMSQSDFI